MKTKKCSKCGKWKSLSEFCKQAKAPDGLAYWCKQCVAAYHQSDKSKAVRTKYRQEHKTKISAYRRTSRRTIIGCLHHRFHSIIQRCNNLNDQAYKIYGKRGIQCLFENADEFANYVINVLQVDPRGLDIHRPDNDGHYEPGNIIFIPRNEHMRLHNAMRREKKRAI